MRPCSDEDSVQNSGRAVRSPCVLLRAPGIREKTIPLSHPFVVGCAPAATLRIRDRSVSRFHFVVLREAGQGPWFVGDLGSTNGLWLNGVRVRTLTRLRTEDCLMFGRNCVMVVKL